MFVEIDVKNKRLLALCCTQESHPLLRQLSAFGALLTVYAIKPLPSIKNAKIITGAYENSALSEHDYLVSFDRDRSMIDNLREECKQRRVLASFIHCHALSDFILTDQIDSSAKDQISISQPVQAPPYPSLRGGVFDQLDRFIKEPVQYTTQFVSRVIKYTSTSAAFETVRKNTGSIISIGISWLPSRLATATKESLEMLQQRLPQSKGSLTIVYAGCSSPLDLTQRSLNAIKNADFVLTDRQLSIEILHHVKSLIASDCILPLVPNSSTAPIKDATTNQLIKDGFKVVQLKSNDGFFLNGSDVYHENAEIIYGVTSWILKATQQCSVGLMSKDGVNQLLILTSVDEHTPRFSEKRTTIFILGEQKVVSVARKLMKQGYSADCPLVLLSRLNVCRYLHLEDIKHVQEDDLRGSFLIIGGSLVAV